MRIAVIVGWVLVGGGLAIQLLLALTAFVAGRLAPNGNLAGDAGFFAAFLGLGVVPLAVLLAVLAGFGRWLGAEQDALFFVRTMWASGGALVVSLGLLGLGSSHLGGGIIPH